MICWILHVRIRSVEVEVEVGHSVWYEVFIVCIYSDRWEADADVGLGVHARDISMGRRTRRAFRRQYKSNISGRWEARKEDWLKVILDYSTILKRSDQWWALEPKPLAGIVQLLTILSCLAFLAGSPALTTSGELSSAFSWLLHVGMTHSSEKCFSKTALVSSYCSDVLSDFPWDSRGLLWGKK